MSTEASADLWRLLAALAETPDAPHFTYGEALGLTVPTSLENWKVAHTTGFIDQCPPYASLIVGEDGRIGGEAADRVGGFRRMLGTEIGDAPDTVIALLYDYAELVERTPSDPQAAHARKAMLWEHLLAWLMPYLDAVQRSAPAPYDAWAELVREVFTVETRVIQPLGALPLHLRAAPEHESLADAATVDAAIHLLLTPIATGIVLTRADLTRAVKTLEPGLAQNSCSFILKDLLDKNTSASFDWLATEARRQAAARTDEQHSLGAIAGFWAERAAATAQSLSALADQTRAEASRRAQRRA